MGLRKLFKKARKAIGLPALTLKNVGKLAAVSAAGPVALGGAVLASKLKNAAVGGVKQVIRAKAAKAASRKLASMPRPAVTAGAATTMPGGAPLTRPRKAKRAKLPRVKRASLLGNADRQQPKRGPGKAQTLPGERKGRKRAAKSPGGAKRKPPTGGLDLRALSASWKAAGKPGTWQGWIAANK